MQCNITVILLLRPFPYLGSAHQVFNLHVLRFCVSSIFTPFSFMYFLITSLHLSFGVPIFRCPPTSTFHVLITTSSSVFLSACPNHLSLAYLIFSLMSATSALTLISSVLIFSILFIPIIHLNIRISVLSIDDRDNVVYFAKRNFLLRLWFHPVIRDDVSNSAAVIV